MNLDFDKGGGRVTVVTRDARTGAILMVAHADREAVARTEASGEMHYTSRTRGLWRKGETSGNVQRVVRLTADCDRDAVLADVVPAGPACHTGTVSCFGAVGEDGSALARLDRWCRSGRRAPTAAATPGSSSPTEISDSRSSGKRWRSW